MNRPATEPASERRRAAFERDGLIMLNTTGLDDDHLEAVVESLRGQYAEDYRSEAGVSYFPDRIMDAWLDNPHVSALATAPLVMEVLHELFGRAPLPFQTLNFEYGTQQDAHSDALHFNSEPAGFLCAVWVALEDVDLDNGPVFYLPGSHEIFPVTTAALERGVRYDESYRQSMTPRAELPAPSLGTLRRGQAMVWSGDLVHGGMPIRVPGRTRQSQVTHYFFEGCRYWVPKLSEPGAVLWREPLFLRANGADR